MPKKRFFNPQRPSDPAVEIDSEAVFLVQAPDGAAPTPVPVDPTPKPVDPVPVPVDPIPHPVDPVPVPANPQLAVDLPDRRVGRRRAVVTSRGVPHFGVAVIDDNDPHWTWRSRQDNVAADPSGTTEVWVHLVDAGDRVKVYTPDFSMTADSAAAAIADPDAPVPGPTPVGGDTLNIMLRGQSNALLFADFGGLGKLRDIVQTQTGRKVNLIYSWGDDGSKGYTIYSGTEFLGEWQTKGYEDRLVSMVGSLSADQKKAPFLTIWMHNESDQKNNPATDTWVAAVRRDAERVRAALGLSAADAPYCFLPVRYNWGNIASIRAGMNRLAGEAGFNAFISEAAWPAKMDWEGADKPDREHLSSNDALNVIAPALAAELVKRFPRVAPPAPPPVTPAPNGGPRAFMTGLGIGLNIERQRAWETTLYGGKTLQRNADYYRYLAGLGVTHCRFFMPFRYEVNMGFQSPPSNAAIDVILDAVQASLDGGMKRAFVDATDVVGRNEMANNWGAIKDYLRRFAERVRDRGFSPEKVAPGPFNELAGDDNPAFNGMRTEAHRIMRAVLPNHTLVTNSCYWGDPEWLEKGGSWEMIADKNAILQTHWYHADYTVEHWRWIEGFHTRFEQKHGIPVYVGEAGYSNGWGNNGHESQGRAADVWTPSINNQVSVMPHRALTLWAMTNGSAWRMNKDWNDATLIPEVERHIRSNAAKIKTPA